MTLDSKNIAILTANGVNQNDIASMQRALIQKRCFPKVIGAGSRLITSWNDTEWGHNFAMDISVTEALGVDYDVLIIPGGARAIEGLKATEHTKRIINSFIAAGKPMVVMGDAAGLFEYFGLASGADNIRLTVETNEETVGEAVSWFESFTIIDMAIDQQAA